MLQPVRHQAVIKRLRITMGRRGLAAGGGGAVDYGEAPANRRRNKHCYAPGRSSCGASKATDLGAHSTL